MAEGTVQLKCGTCGARLKVKCGSVVQVHRCDDRLTHLLEIELNTALRLAAAQSRARRAS